MEQAPSRRSFVGGATAVVMLARPFVARAAPRIIKVGHNGVATTQYGQALASFAAAAAGHPELCNSIAIEVHGFGEFGDDAPMLADCQAGILDMVACATSVAGRFCPDIGILDIPFLFRDIQRSRAAIDGAAGDEYANLLAAARLPVIAWLEIGLRHFTANRPIRAPADLVGLKLRVLPSQSAIEAFRGLGADAKPLPYNQLYEALRVAQFDAEENAIFNIETIHLNEVQKYLCLSGHNYSTGLLVASGDLVEELTTRQVAALRACGRAATHTSREVADGGERDGVARLRRLGMTVIDDVDTSAFVKAAAANLDRLSQRFSSWRMQRLIETAG